MGDSLLFRSRGGRFRLRIGVVLWHAASWLFAGRVRLRCRLGRRRRRSGSSRRRRGRSRGVRRSEFQIARAILQESDLDATATGNPTGLAVFGLLRSITHADGEDAIDGDFMLQDEVTYDRVRDLARVLHSGSARARSITTHLDHVALLALQRGRQIVQCVLRLLAQGGLARAEADLSFARGLELVNVGYDLLHRVQTFGGLGRGLVSELGAVAGIDSVLVGFVGAQAGYADTFGSACVNVFDRLSVGGGELVELVHASTHRIKLALHILFAGERIQMSPKSFLARVLQGVFTGRGLGGVRGG